MKSLSYILMVFFICCLIIVSVEMKFLGAYNYSPKVENEGFCVLKYGEGYKNFNNERCFLKQGNISKEFSKEEVLNFCDKPNLISTKFFSDCWIEGHNSLDK